MSSRGVVQFSADSARVQRILIRADGSSTIGLGHVVRSFVLARELHDLGVEVEVWGSSVTEGKALAESFQIVAIRELSHPLGGAAELGEVLSFNPDLVVADGYHFEHEFFEALEKKAISYGVIDDNGETQAISPVFVLNQNPSADHSVYQELFPGARLFLGSDFALLRREVSVATERRQRPRKRNSVLVSMGGSDVEGLTDTVSRCLAGSGFDVSVSVGPAAQNAGFGPKAASLGYQMVDSDGLLQAMATAEICVLAAGSTLWEANNLSQQIIAIVVADNQIKPAEAALENSMVDAVLDARVASRNPNLCSQLLETIVSIRSQSRDKRMTIPLDGARNVAARLRRMDRLV